MQEQGGNIPVKQMCMSGRNQTTFMCAIFVKPRHLLHPRKMFHPLTREMRCLRSMQPRKNE